MFSTVLFFLCAISLASSLSFNNREFEAAEAEDQNFLATQWRDLQTDLLKIQQEIAKDEEHSSGFLQIRTTPAVKAKKEQKKADAKMEPSQQLAASPEMDRLTTAESMVKGLTGKAMLAPMLGMLNSMYDDQKKRIGEINKREQKSKDRFAKQQSDFNAKITSINDRHKNHKLSDEFWKNETRDYTRQFKYWEGVRSRNHRQFHNALKITHGMMQNEKNMISKYEAAMSMKLDNKPTNVAPAKPQEAPEVVFMQQRKVSASFIEQTLVEVRRHLVEMHAESAPLLYRESQMDA